MTIKTYKDGDDIIVVFKRPSSDLLDVLNKTFGIQVEPTVVPDLEAPPEHTEEPLADAQPLMIRTFSEFVEMTAEMMVTKIHAEKMEACRQFYESHNKIMADVISKLELPRVKGFIVNCYTMNIDAVEAFNESQYSTIKEFADSLPERDLRKLAQKIGDGVVSFFETH